MKWNSKLVQKVYFDSTYDQSLYTFSTCFITSRFFIPNDNFFIFKQSHKRQYNSKTCPFFKLPHFSIFLYISTPNTLKIATHRLIIIFLLIFIILVFIINYIFFVTEKKDYDFIKKWISRICDLFHFFLFFLIFCNEIHQSYLKSKSSNIYIYKYIQKKKLRGPKKKDNMIDGLHWGRSGGHL